ncbi:MAG: alpha/beta hydrolase-fold protein [Bacteroidales bacterium]|nr:alpha/beta hydrolase-fold protein [Bacteroidales bacterium]
MKLKTILLSYLLFTIYQSFAGDDLRIMESSTMRSRILNQDVHFSVCLPSGYYQTAQSYPVVYLLHGLGDDETSWLEYGRISQIADEEVAKGEIHPMIYIMPEGFRTYYVNDYKGTFLYQDMFVNELVPFVDSVFRTIRNKQHRAVMGYSMGGFGALILHLKHPDVFGVAVPLSTSIRTDEQYITEDISGWDEQWGRLFGAPGLRGADRLTDYYKGNNPFYILNQLSQDEISDLHLFLDNGDKEHTLCRSNEELHILMRNKNIHHEYRVRNGGHSFTYWCSALPNALRFIDDEFEEKPYRRDRTISAETKKLNSNQLITSTINNQPYLTVVPVEYDQTNRLYPVIYFAGDFTTSQCQSIAEVVNDQIETAKVCPMILVFLPDNAVDQIKNTIPLLEDKWRIREGFRMRALVGYQSEGLKALDAVINQVQFRMFAILDGFITQDIIMDLLINMNAKSMERTSIFIEAPDKGKFYQGNGNLHMMLRDMNIKHEYRVKEGFGGFEWTLAGLEEVFEFASTSFHK